MAQRLDDGSNQTLLQLVRNELLVCEQMTFARYMDLALYHPVHGYYSSRQPRIGPQGDYYTSADVSPLFGATIGRQLLEMWRLMERPHPYAIVELGAGKGLLAADILGWAGAAHPDFFSALQYLIVEISPGSLAYQRERLAALPVRWTGQDLLDPGSLVGCILSNEVADALPFHRVRWLDGRLAEIWVTERDGRLTEVWGEPSTPLLRDYLDGFGVALSEGQTAEVNLKAPEWVQLQIDVLSSGFVLCIDYGNTASELYGPRFPDGSLACYYRHTLNKEPLRNVGEQDITARVNFTALARAARESGARIAGYTSQAYFLASLGLGEALRWSSERSASAREFERDRAAVEQLIRPDGLGGFRVLGARKGVSARSLTGFSLHSDPI